MNDTQNHAIRGILFMILHAVSVAGLFTTMKYLTRSFQAVELVFFYKIMLLGVTTVWVLAKGIKHLVIKEMKWVIWRGIISSVASISFMSAIQYVDLVNATALGYLEQIIWVILGVLYFQEKLSFIRLILITMSICGALILIFPKIFNNIYDIIGFQYGISYGDVDWHYLLVMLAVVCWGINAGIIKRLGKTVKVEIQLFYTMLFAAIISFCTAYIKWEFISLSGFPLIIPTALMGATFPLLVIRHDSYCFYFF